MFEKTLRNVDPGPWSLRESGIIPVRHFDLRPEGRFSSTFTHVFSQLFPRARITVPVPPPIDRIPGVADPSFAQKNRSDSSAEASCCGSRASSDSSGLKGPESTECTCGFTSPIDPEEAKLHNFSQRFNRWLTYGQSIALVAIAIATLVGIGLSIWEMVGKETVGLGDLLMLFLYIEILSMVKGGALGTREIPIHTPIALAIVAVARYIVVDVEHLKPLYMFLTSASILVLVLALWIVRRIVKKNDSLSL